LPNDSQRGYKKGRGRTRSLGKEKKGKKGGSYKLDKPKTSDLKATATTGKRTRETARERGRNNMKRNGD